MNQRTFYGVEIVFSFISKEIEDSTKVTWRIPDRVIKKVKHRATEKNLSTSALVAKILEEYLDRKCQTNEYIITTRK
jgi:hypothetical protein